MFEVGLDGGCPPGRCDGLAYPRIHYRSAPSTRSPFPRRTSIPRGPSCAPFALAPGREMQVVVGALSVGGKVTAIATATRQHHHPLPALGWPRRVYRDVGAGHGARSFPAVRLDAGAGALLIEVSGEALRDRGPSWSAILLPQHRQQPQRHRLFSLHPSPVIRHPSPAFLPRYAPSAYPSSAASGTGCSRVSSVVLTKGRTP